MRRHMVLPGWRPARIVIVFTAPFLYNFLDSAVRTPLWWLMAASFALAGAARGPQPDPALPTEYSTLVSTYCITCHNDRLKTGGLSLQSAAAAPIPAHPEIWERVARKLRTGEM